MSLTVAQGIQAGNYAQAIDAMTAFIGTLQSNVAASVTLASINLTYTSGASQATVNFPAGLSASDTAALLNALIALGGSLIAEYTTDLQGM